MNEKYIIRFDENNVLAIRWNWATNELMIGGDIRRRLDIEMTFQEYFREDPPMPETIKVGGRLRKIKYTKAMELDKYVAGLQRLKDNKLLQEVHNHGRILR